MFTEIRLLQRLTRNHKTLFVAPVSSWPERIDNAWGYRYLYVEGNVLGVDGEFQANSSSLVEELGRIAGSAALELSNVWHGAWEAPRAVSGLRRELLEGGSLLCGEVPKRLVSAILSNVRLSAEMLDMVGGVLPVQYVHGDIHAGNVVVPDGGGAKVIDTSGLRIRTAVREVGAALAKLASDEGRSHGDVLDDWRLTLSGYMNRTTILPGETRLVPVAVGAKLVGELCYLLRLKRNGAREERYEQLFMRSARGCEVLAELFEDLIELVKVVRSAQPGHRRNEDGPR